MRQPDPVLVEHLLNTVDAWRNAERTHAFIVLGELSGDAAEAKATAERALHDVRIAHAQHEKYCKEDPKHADPRT